MIGGSLHIRIGRPDQPDLFWQDDSVHPATELRLVETQGPPGPRLVIADERLHLMQVPAQWRNCREKDLAALRRTIAAVALQLADARGTRVVVASDILLCALPSLVVAQSTGAHLVLCLSPEDIEPGLFNDSQLAVLDACLTGARLVVVPDSEAARLLAVHFPASRSRIIAATELSNGGWHLLDLLDKETNDTVSIAWQRAESQFMPVSCPCASGSELLYVEEVLRSGWWGYGPVARHLEQQMVRLCGGGVEALAVINCTAALHLALAALDLERGDEVVIPALSFTSTAMAAVLAGGTPRFCDIDPATLSLSPASLAAALTARTRAVITVHFAGIPVDLPALELVLKGHRAIVVEDAAHALGAVRDGCPVGSRSLFTCFSFAPTKSVAAGSGGVLVYRDPSIRKLLRELSNVGLFEDTFDRCQRLPPAPGNLVARIGYRYRLDDINAAVIFGQLEQLDRKLAARAQLVNAYRMRLDGVRGCDLLQVPTDARPSWYVFPIRVPPTLRDELRATLASKGFDTSIHYPNLAEQPAFVQFCGDVPIARRESQRLISLPLHEHVYEEDIDAICGIISEFLVRRAP